MKEFNCLENPLVW